MSKLFVSLKLHLFSLLLTYWLFRLQKNKVNRRFHVRDICRGRRLFKSSEFLTVQQITSYFSRLSAKVRQQVVTTEEDICAAAEEANFHKARADILLAMNLEHPIVFDQYNICDLVDDNRLKNLKLGLLQMLCKKFNLQGSVTDRRKKSFIHRCPG